MVDTFARYRNIVGSPADWAGAGDIVIGLGEIAVEIDGSLIQFKIGDGIQTFSQLDYQAMTLSTDQTVTGEKTFTQDIKMQNQLDPTSYGAIYSTDYLGSHSIQMDGFEPNSSVYMIARDNAGDPLVFSVFQNGGVYFQDKLIADENGIHANSIARFNATVYFFQQDTDNGGDLAEYYQLDVNDSNGGNRLRFDSPFNDSEIVLYARNDIGVATFYRFTANGYVLAEYETQDTDPDNALVTKAWVEAAIAAAL